MRAKQDRHPTNHEAAVAFGMVLRNQRRARGLTQDSLAEASNLTSQYVSMLERGVNQPSFRAIVMLATGLGVEPADLVGEAFRALVDTSAMSDGTHR